MDNKGGWAKQKSWMQRLEEKSIIWFWWWYDLLYFFLLFEENLEIKKIWLHENRKIQDQGTIVASDVTKNAKATSLRGADWSKKMDPHSPTSQVGCPDYLNFKVLHDVRMLIGLG